MSGIEAKAVSDATEEGAVRRESRAKSEGFSAGGEATQRAATSGAASAVANSRRPDHF